MKNKDLSTAIYSPEDIEHISNDIKTALVKEIVETRKSKRLSQKDIEKISGVPQPVIARMETEINNPHLNTFIKILVSLGKTIYITDLPDLQQQNNTNEITE